MKISRLRLLGFKSFVEPTELVIEPGLTGVVGPNGCGKSNLLEALRWVMGETSHKSMRAAAMDDVIFSGTNHRPARHFAEVTLFLDNTARQAPAEFNDRDQIEITRRIEREAGSSYRINAREARARDIKLLFEDAATGARSPALVRQGQIAEIVNAKPEQRRRILEDAAGVAGLHSRRHEAELRLKAAEANLARVADVLGQVTSQMESLKRQARQARRYKELSEDIRRAEALLLHLAWADAHDAVVAEEKAHEAALGALADLTSREAAAFVAEQRAAEALPSYREAEAKKAAALARLKNEAENFEREVARAIERQRELQARAAQLAADLAREEAQATEAAELAARLEAEAAELAEAEAFAGDDDIDAHERHAEAARALAEADAKLAAVTARAAEARAALRSLETGIAERRENRERLQRQLAALETQAREVAARAPDVRQLTDTQSLGQQLAAELLDIEAATLAAEARAQHLREDVRVKRREAETARLSARALSTERETLVRLLVTPHATGLPGIADQLRVSNGYETALGAALGDDLEAPRLTDDDDGGGDAAADATPPLHWRLVETPPSDPALPSEAEPLAKHVKGPPELKRRLKQTGVVPRELGARLQAHLKPGQRLVSREGDLWRWDGFVAAAEGATAAAERLAQRNRLAGLEYDEAQAVEAADLIAEAETLATDALAAAEDEERQLRQSWRATQMRLAEARERLTRVEQSARETEGRLAAINEARERAADDLQAAMEREAELSEALAIADPTDATDADLATAREDCERWRAAVASAAALVAEQQRARRARAERRAAVTAEQKRWSGRHDAALAHVAALRERYATAQAELDALAELPSNLGERRDALLSAISTAEAERRQAGDDLATAETAMRDAQQALRGVQATVSNEREARARIEARLEAARTRRQDEARRIREALGVVPEGCLPLAGLAAGDELPPLADVDRQLTRLKADRERLGGVNLSADDELEAMSSQFSALDAERADVEQAVAKLRGAIQQINREARKRLGEAFTTVDGHFRRLFSTLFGGGEARLEMIEGDDPLESGLEIVAKPPGKKPATLSLLSGGEQTLTALSLIFAVFLTNPSPICVLDEVDAPLDDANVDRFCTLMEKMAEETATRFLVITHHPMTMARMNRLFGVTMAERGVSQLVSVNLETAAQFLEAV